MAYGSVAGVAGLDSMYTDAGSYTTGTKPTLAQVNIWLGQVSALVDTALADEGFTTPITVSEITTELDLLVNGIVKDLVDYSHRAGRFFSKRVLDDALSPFMAIDAELHEWVKRKTLGFELQGALKSQAGRSIATFDVL